ncbi:hypothetical protein [Streptomyces erythrochromogenes]|uniref:hypothetical protein n=1 Tax=Streptomyces erythrochromogenes TaxID=285574 RepID=UPI0037FE0CCB
MGGREPALAPAGTLRRGCEHGQVYQLLAEDARLDGSSDLTTLFETARTHLLIDVP